ncbi:MAG: hypothetical protein ABSA30_00670 [Candidatus Aminicenantales bacterium]|jgi:F0F1-type ATP synthase membrane subunit a
MEKLEHSLAIVGLFNRIFGPPIAAFLGLFGVHVQDPRNCIADYVVMVLIVAVFMIVLFTLAGRKRALVPGRMQNVLEMIVEFFESQMAEIIGP